jgi:hypothetical protein
MRNQTETLSVKITKPLKIAFETWCWKNRRNKSAVIRVFIRSLTVEGGGKEDVKS